MVPRRLLGTVELFRSPPLSLPPNSSAMQFSPASAAPAGQKDCLDDVTDFDPAAARVVPTEEAAPAPVLGRHAAGPGRKRTADGGVVNDS